VALPYTFANQTTPVLSELDANFAALGALTVIPCSVTGTNTLSLSAAANTPTITAYANYQAFSCVAGAANTGASQARVDGLALLSIYKDTPGGPIALVGGEIGAGSIIFLTYDSALSVGAGGFHLQSGTNGPALGVGAATTVPDNTGITLTAAQVTGSGTGQGVIDRQGSPGAPYNDQAPTATAIIGALPGAVVGTVFRFRVVNTSGQTQTITTNSGISLVGGVTTANNASHDYIGIVNNVGSPAVTIYG